MVARIASPLFKSESLQTLRGGGNARYPRLPGCNYPEARTGVGTQYAPNNNLAIGPQSDLWIAYSTASSSYFLSVTLGTRTPVYN